MSVRERSYTVQVISFTYYNFWLANVLIHLESMMEVETTTECSNAAFDVMLWIADLNRLTCSSYSMRQSFLQTLSQANRLDDFLKGPLTLDRPARIVSRVETNVECGAALSPIGGSWIPMDLVTSRTNWRWSVQLKRVSLKYFKKNSLDAIQGA